jgi:GNAT superfamily N-acetyltransferase
MYEAAMGLSIRRATPADLEIITEYNLRLAAESEGKALDRATLRAGVARCLADPVKGIYFLACQGDAILGQTMFTYEWSDWRNGWFWWIQSVYVRADARGQGVFRALFDHVLAEAKRQGDVIGVRLYVEENNTAAQAVYAKLGMDKAGYFVLERCPLGE